ncbi:hypothetical protein HDU96_008629 [Phlyctochytrium bullatum]|nr:hypothetical protein HDU96_008629 [Phlyctochytrium bullatum]
MRRKNVFALSVLCLLLLTMVFFLQGWERGDGSYASFSPAPQEYVPRLVRAKKGAVSTENVLCSDIGVDILKQGGSAVDAGIASSLCIGVTNSYSSGIGGGGFMLIRGKNGTYRYVDFREAAPRKAFVDMYKEDPLKAQVGGLAVGVPGEIRGFEWAHKHYGKLPWKTLFQPAIKVCRDGWRANAMLAKRVEVGLFWIAKGHNLTASAKDYILADKTFAEVFAPNGTLITEGQIVRRERLAKALELIAEEGPSAFYEGDIARSILETVEKNGGILTKNDMKNYQVEIRDALIGYYHGTQVATTPSPASGAVLLSILNILEGYNLPMSGNTPLNIHRITEAMKFAYAQRGYYGDPADPIYKNITELEHEFSGKKVASTIRGKLSDSKTFDPPHYDPGHYNDEDHGTMHVSAMTADGEAVSITSTVNLIFGARIADPDYGIILNDEMDDFSIPGVPNAFGLAPSPYNFIHPFKRPLSSSVPVITEINGRLDSVAGASGGSRIITSTLLVLLGMLDFNLDVARAIGLPRFHHQLFPNEVGGLGYRCASQEDED